MSRYWCAILLIAITLDFSYAGPLPEGELSARDYYQQAAELIGHSKHSQAVEPLRELIDAYPEDELANLATFYLAECYLVAGDASAAIKTLGRYRPEDDQQVAKSERLRRQAIQVAANQAIRAGELENALKWYQRAIVSSASAKERQSLNQAFVRIGLAHCRKQWQSGMQPSKVLQIIPTEHPSATENLAAIQFGFAETLYRAGRPKAASEHYDALAANLQDSAKPGQPTWMPTVYLRRAEIALRQREYLLAISIADDAEKRFPDSELLHEFTFIKAQCDISRIEFESALDRLSHLLSLEVASSTTRRRAAWMSGEVYFLQKKYPEAMQAYRRASELASESGEQTCVWNRRSMLQSAKCLELVGQRAQAQSMYQRIASEFADCSESKFASDRMAVLQQLQATTQQ